MRSERLHAALIAELQKHSAMTFQAAAELTDPIRISSGTPGADDFYQGEVYVLQQVHRGGDDWIQLIVSLDDGRPDAGLMGTLFGTVTPQTASFVIHRDGRVETFL